MAEPSPGKQDRHPLTPTAPLDITPMPWAVRHWRPTMLGIGTVYFDSAFSKPYMREMKLLSLQVCIKLSCRMRICIEKIEKRKSGGGRPHSTTLPRCIKTLEIPTGRG